MSCSEEQKEDILLAAGRIIRNGGIVAYPTESFYALGAAADNAGAVTRLFLIKKRPPDKPIPLIIDSCKTLKSVVREIPEGAESLMSRYWPGPLTLIFRARDQILPQLTGGTGRVAVRVPGVSLALDLVRSIGAPVTATSANISGLPAASDAGHVRQYFGAAVDLVIDCGETPGGKASTIIDLTVEPFSILREGMIMPEGY